MSHEKKRSETCPNRNTLDTRIRSRLWDSRQMASGSSQARTMEQFVCGTPRLDTRWQAHSLDTGIRSCLWDSRQMASGSSQARTMEQFVWNATTGDTVAGPFTGHRYSVRSVGFSPDGQRIVSGSDDGTIRVWNATTGDTVAGPFTGHTDSVRSVGFLPDGQWIISGSNDETIRVWNATTGHTVAGPFTGHTDGVNSVGFSPDGQRIVSGSDDGTIRVWNATTGDTVASPFTGQTHSVTSTGLSSDSQRIVSSGDKSIQMLDDTTESLITITQVNFTDQSVINDDGWICGNRRELLMWIPPVHRAHLHRPRNIWVAGEYETRLDLSNFVHGPSWMSCIDS